VTYRDESEALRTRNDALERELEETRREVLRLRAERATTEPPPWAQPAASSNRSVFFVAGILAVLMALVVARAFARAHVASEGGCPFAHGGHFVAARGWDPPGSPRVASAWGHLPTFYQVVERSARVTETHGHAAVAAGAECTVRVFPVSSPRFNCRVEVQCGEAMVYGDPRSGFTQCAIEDELPVSAHDLAATYEDGDARLDMDLNLDALVVTDDEPTPGFMVKLAVDPLP
jgi:hypothetical protein